MPKTNDPAGLPAERLDFISAFFRSIVDLSAYRQFRRASFGQAFRYLLVVLLLLTFISLSDFIASFPRLYQDVMARLARAPEFSFRDGKLAVAGPMPLVIEKSADTFILVDTSGRTTPLVLEPYASGALLTRDSYTTKENHQTTTRDLSAFRSITFDKNGALSWLNGARWYIYFLIITFVYAVNLLGKLFTALLLSGLAFWLYTTRRFRLPFGDVFKMAIYAMTLPMTLAAVLARVWAFHLSFVIIILISLLYLYLAGEMFRKENEG